MTCAVEARLSTQMECCIVDGLSVVRRKEWDKKKIKY